ncbi:hypothetical protein [Pelosinus sp. UFO1]|uniref:hypothetical protein n=1 Tax=Pelosinus sp. UFO1 TaxID=484770 RepID=UPI0004D0B871|nr:hypothetical protein [Pelosinus sp. UFO1]AIF50291.1 hypothetical protein UFO1_0736 [Pelosinus sp. UFO1]
MFRLGVDIGYSTFKYIILDDKEREIGSEYVFHRGNIETAFSNMLQKIENEYKIKEFYFGITGDQAERMPKLGTSQCCSSAKDQVSIYGDNIEKVPTVTKQYEMVMSV